MSRIYNKYIDQAIRSVEPTLGQDKTNAFKRNLESKKLFKKAEAKKIEKKTEKKAKGGRVGLKGGSDFPDYSGDGKTTMKDILMGRGVIPKPKNKKMVAKKTKTPMQKAIKKDKNKKRFI